MKILVVDDHALVRRAVRSVLEELEPEACLLEASSGERTLRIAEDNADLDLIVLDLNLPDRDGFSVLTELRERHASIAIVVLSASDSRDDISRVLQLGALGFIPKTTEHDILVNALQLVFSGGVYIPPEILRNRQLPDRDSATPQPAATAVAERACDLGLTGRQVEVLGLMMQGKSNKLIARALDMAEATVKNHVTAILKVLNVANRTEAVIKAGKLGLSPTAETQGQRRHPG
jgi:DNA-binding NarL/FixJ family response regulator